MSQAKEAVEYLTCRMPDVSNGPKLEEWLRGRLAVPADIRASACDCCDECPRKFFWKYRVGVIPQGYSIKDWTGASALGSYFHKYMELGNEELYHQYVEDQVAKSRVDTSDLEEELGILDGVDVSIRRVAQKALCLGRVYNQRSMLTGTGHTPIATEVEWQIPLQFRTENQTLKVGVRMDLLTRKDDWALLVDYKSTTLNAGELVEVYPLSHAFKLYRFAARHFLDTNCPGATRSLSFLIGVIQVPGIRFCPATKDRADTPEASFSKYVDRCKEWYVGQELEAVREFHSTCSDPEELSPSFIREEYEKYVPTFSPWISWPKIDNLLQGFHQRPNHCRSGWKGLCPYHDLCLSSMPRLPHTLGTLYKQCIVERNPWKDPTK